MVYITTNSYICRPTTNKQYKQLLKKERFEDTNVVIRRCKS
jgi:hypothetical protein